MLIKTEIIKVLNMNFSLETGLLITMLVFFILFGLLLVTMTYQTRKLKQALLHQKQQQDDLVIRLEERHKYEIQHQQNILQQILHRFKEQQESQHQFQHQFDQHQIQQLKALYESLQKGFQEIRQENLGALKLSSENMTQSVDKLNQNTEKYLKEISGQVEKRLTEGFEKTSAVFTDIVKRLALIDEAQKKITELSSEVVSLQQILSDKRSRGVFGEIQLYALIRNVLPERNFAIQPTLSNGKRPDCMLYLPEPTGNIAIDAKFPLEHYHQLTQHDLPKSQYQQAERLFKESIQKHIQDIAQKYIIPGETAEGAVMFLPAEAVFAEIHARHPDLIESAHRLKVWIVSPTTLMAILTTARAVLKDIETQKQVHIIQKHLIKLGEDFFRFQERIEKLSKHINLAHQDVEQVQTSSQKIMSRFHKIEKAEFTSDLLEADAETM